MSSLISPGNAGTPLLRIPLFRQILLPSSPQSSFPNLKIIAFAPRSYWLSSRSAPTQTGLLADYTSVLLDSFSSHPPETKFILYGHSLGGSILLFLLSNPELKKKIAGVILENPLPSIPYMVKALYPQKWLPYHYLSPFVFDRWDTLALVRKDKELLKGVRSLWIRSGKDEIIPQDPDGGVKNLFEGVDGEDKKWVEIEDALHDTAFLSRKWKAEIREFMQEVRTGKCKE